MPELPEVEHVVRALRPVVVGRRILAAELNLKRISPEVSRAKFDKQLKNLRINAVGRRGKYILFELDSGGLLTTHLRMTGKFVALSADDKLPPYSHVVFYLDNEKLQYNVKRFKIETTTLQNKFYFIKEGSELKEVSTEEEPIHSASTRAKAAWRMSFSSISRALSV